MVLRVLPAELALSGFWLEMQILSVLHKQEVRPSPNLSTLSNMSIVDTE